MSTTSMKDIMEHEIEVLLPLATEPDGSRQALVREVRA